MEYQRGVRPEKLQGFASENGLTSNLVSARSGENVRTYEKFTSGTALPVIFTASWCARRISHTFTKMRRLQVALCFQKLAAELLGVRLTRAEQEQHQPVVRAEISNSHTCAHDAAGPTRQRQAIGARSAVCSLQ